MIEKGFWGILGCNHTDILVDTVYSTSVESVREVPKLLAPGCHVLAEPARRRCFPSCQQQPDPSKGDCFEGIKP